MIDAKEKEKEKEKELEMEWTRMQENKSYGRTILRVLTAYKKAMLLGLLGISLVLGAVLVSQVVGNEEKPIRHREQAQEQEPYHEPVSNFKGDRFTVLLVGVDRRPGDPTLSNTDTLLVASVNTVNGKVALLSIPRDTQVTVPGFGKGKINVAARVGKGISTTTALIEGLTGQSIDGYVITNFNGFKSIIDTLGGITLNVEKNMYYVTGDSSDDVINLKKGTQRLYGEQALQYARFRQDALADISRTARQQAVIKAIAKEFLQVKTVPKLPWLVPQIAKSVETNLSIAQLWAMTHFLLRNENSEISSQTLPGNFLIENDISYWKVNPQKSHAVVKRLFEEGKTSSTFFGD